MSSSNTHHAMIVFDGIKMGANIFLNGHFLGNLWKRM